MHSFKKFATALVLVLVAVISVFFLSDWASDVQNHQGTIVSVDQKITTVMELTAASTTASAVISAIPDDTATPIAEKLADFSTYFLFVLCALYLEKYLATVTGFAAFTVLIPLACGIGIVSLYWNERIMRKISMKLALFATALFLVIPASIGVSDMIYATYQESIDATIDTAKNSASILEGAEDQGMLETIVNTVSTVAGNLINSATNILRDFIEALAVMIVTSCVIPMLVLLFFVWLMKVLLGIDGPISAADFGLNWKGKEE